jgi:hypothetical protein
MIDGCQTLSLHGPSSIFAWLMPEQSLYARIRFN